MAGSAVDTNRTTKNHDAGMMMTNSRADLRETTIVPNGVKKRRWKIWMRMAASNRDRDATHNLVRDSSNRGYVTIEALKKHVKTMTEPVGDVIGRKMGIGIYRIKATQTRNGWTHSMLLSQHKPTRRKISSAGRNE